MEGEMRRLRVVVSSLLLAGSIGLPALTQSAAASDGDYSAQRGAFKVNDYRVLSSGARLFFLGLSSGSPQSTGRRLSFGSNVDANDPKKDYAAGQAEVSIGADGKRAVAAWNDVSGFLVANTLRRDASITGVGYTTNGGTSFTDVIGLRNDDARERWSGDPTVVAIDHAHFVVGSLYLPEGNSCDAHFEIAVAVARIRNDGSIALGLPVVAADGGSQCSPDSSFLDKEFLAYDPTTRTMALAYTRYGSYNPPAQCGNGEIDLVRAHVPDSVADLASSDFSAPVVVSPEEPCGGDIQTGSYPAVSPAGNVYVAWERNIDSNLFSGQDPFVYILAAAVRAGKTTPTPPVTVTINQAGATSAGGVKSLDATQITGFSRFLGQDFPRIAYNPVTGGVVVEWNDATAHPLGDIYLKSLSATLGDNATSPVRKVNDDDSYALHFLPAVSVRDDGTICSSWYDRRTYGADSTKTDYYADCRPDAATNGTDFAVTTGPTDWAGTGSLIDPNFGDYTDNTSTGDRTYFIWTDGRIGVPQPFVDTANR
jgi:hypothetical protein